jgi:hypothetical protein
VNVTYSLAALRKIVVEVRFTNGGTRIQRLQLELSPMVTSRRPVRASETLVFPEISSTIHGTSALWKALTHLRKLLASILSTFAQRIGPAQQILTTCPTISLILEDLVNTAIGGALVVKLMSAEP